jgi:hypothetical protein
VHVEEDDAFGSRLKMGNLDSERVRRGSLLKLFPAALLAPKRQRIASEGAKTAPSSP